MDSITAHIRAAVYDALEDPDTNKPSLPDEVLIANLLILGYLQRMGHTAAASVLLKESGMHEAEGLAAACATDVVRARLSREPKLLDPSESWLEAMVRERL